MMRFLLTSGPSRRNNSLKWANVEKDNDFHTHIFSKISPFYLYIFKITKALAVSAKKVSLIIK